MENRENLDSRQISDETDYDINRIPYQSQDHGVLEKTSLAYEGAFDLIVRIVTDIFESSERNKIFNILLKLMKNILTNPNEEKFRKLKLSNNNIQTLFQISGAYDFFIFLGFREEFMDGELYMFSDNIDLELFKLVYSYLNLLIVNEEDLNENSYNRDNADEFVVDINQPVFDEMSAKSRSSAIRNKKKTIVDILKETKDSRVLGNNQNITNNLTNNTSSNNFRSNRPKDIKSVLKETAGIRRNNSDYDSNDNFPSSNINNFNYKYTNQSIYGNSNGSSNGNSNGNYSSNSRFATLNDIKFNNPDINSIFKHSFKVTDSIGKKCLELSNEFRRRNGLSPLQWEDNVWKISFEHSRNMGIYKVKFGHDGFNERIRKLPFYYSLACENVFMCQGVSEYSLAEMAVNGWINSPGHRKNLVSNSSHCSIAVYKNDAGEYFLTQIFVKK